MANTKITDLTEKATGAATDEFAINDVAGGNVDKKMGMDGILISGTHAVADLRGIGRDKRRKKRRRVSEFLAVGKITTLEHYQAISSLLKQKQIGLESKIRKSNDLKTNSKIMEEKKLDFVDGKWISHESEINDKIKESKLAKIRKLFNLYKVSNDE